MTNVLSDVVQITADALGSQSNAHMATVITVPGALVNLISHAVKGVKTHQDIQQAKQEAKEAEMERNFADKQYKEDVRKLPNERMVQGTKELLKNQKTRGLQLSQSSTRGSNLTPKLRTKPRKPLRSSEASTKSPIGQINRSASVSILGLKSEKRLEQAQNKHEILKNYAKEKASNQRSNVASTVLAVGGSLSSAVSSTVGMSGYFLKATELGMASTATGIVGACCGVALSAKNLYDDYKNHKDLAKRPALKPLTEQQFFTNASPDQQKLFKKGDYLLPNKTKIRFSVASHSIGASLGLIAMGAGTAGLAGASFGLALPAIFGVGALTGIGFAATKFTERREKKKTDQALLKELDHQHVKEYLLDRGKDSQKVQGYLDRCEKKLEEVQTLKDTLEEDSLDKDSIKSKTQQLKVAQREALKFMQLARES